MKSSHDAEPTAAGIDGRTPIDPVRGDAAVRGGLPVDVRALLQGAREVLLDLDGELYRLRITSRQKLILTK